ncbi:MAG TPA: low affinity iron permease family protein [Flavobacteriales bacterium]|nr:low affinity iron permease family protein [Flavobacteriales bacterium]
MRKKEKSAGFFERAASIVTKATGSTAAFTCALIVVLGWLCSGPFFNYSQTWQLIINTGTTIVTFLMVFLIQKSQNKDSLAIQLKLNELIASQKLASNRMVDVENLTEEELEIIHTYYQRLRDLAKNEGSLFTSHSIDEAQKRHENKKQVKQRPKKRFKHVKSGKRVDKPENRINTV